MKETKLRPIISLLVLVLLVFLVSFFLILLVVVTLLVRLGWLLLVLLRGCRLCLTLLLGRGSLNYRLSVISLLVLTLLVLGYGLLLITGLLHNSFQVHLLALIIRVVISELIVEVI